MSDDLTFGPDDSPWEPCDCVDRIPALEAEVERLRAYAVALHKDRDAEVERLREDNEVAWRLQAEAQAEVERLRNGERG